MAKYNDQDDDDDNYNSSCCIGCCRAGDFGTHDGCGPCYCRRSFKPDHDRTICTGWSLGQYYPGESEHGGPPITVGKEKPKSSEKSLDGLRQESEQQTRVLGEAKGTTKNETDESVKASKTSSKIGR